MQALALRALFFGVLLALYFVHPAVGIAALAGGFGYAVVQRVNRADA